MDPLPRIKLNTAGKVVCQPDWRWDNTTAMPDYDLITILKGTGYYDIDGQSFTAQAGTCLLLPPGTFVQGTLDPHHPMTVIFAHFDFVNSRGKIITPSHNAIPQLYRVLENPMFFNLLLDQLLQSFYQRDHGQHDWLGVCLRLLHQQDSRPRRSPLEQQHSDYMHQLCETIRQAPQRQWRVGQLAEKFGCSEDHFSRIFRQSVAMSPGEFIIQTRIEAAQGLLVNSSYSIGRIAQLLGYTDVYAFSKQFRQKVGRPPSRFRQGK